MAHVAFLGSGLIGSGMVARQRALGADVVVWNRTHEKTAPLVELGARAVTDPADAVRGAARVHVVLSDDAAVDSVLERAASALASNQLVVDHSTTLPKTTAERAHRLGAMGIHYLHAPVFMSPAACRNAAGVMLVAGPAGAAKAARDDLAKMTGEVWFVGERPDLAAAYKLFGNAMIFSLCAGLSDVFAMGKALGVSAPDVHELFSHFNVAAVLEYRGKAMSRGDFTPSFELSMARKDLRLMLEAAAPDRELLAVLPAIERRFDELLARGHGKDDLGVLAVDATGTSR